MVQLHFLLEAKVQLNCTFFPRTEVSRNCATLLKQKCTVILLFLSSSFSKKIEVKIDSLYFVYVRVLVSRVTVREKS